MKKRFRHKFQAIACLLNETRWRLLSVWSSVIIIISTGNRFHTSTWAGTNFITSKSCSHNTLEGFSSHFLTFILIWWRSRVWKIYSNTNWEKKGIKRKNCRLWSIFFYDALLWHQKLPSSEYLSEKGILCLNGTKKLVEKSVMHTMGLKLYVNHVTTVHPINEIPYKMV